MLSRYDEERMVQSNVDVLEEGRQQPKNEKKEKTNSNDGQITLTSMA